MRATPWAHCPSADIRAAREDGVALEGFFGDDRLLPGAAGPPPPFPRGSLPASSSVDGARQPLLLSEGGLRAYETLHAQLHALSASGGAANGLERSCEGTPPPL